MTLWTWNFQTGSTCLYKVSSPITVFETINLNPFNITANQQQIDSLTNNFRSYFFQSFGTFWFFWNFFRILTSSRNDVFDEEFLNATLWTLKWRPSYFMIDHQIHSKCKSILAYFRFSYNCFLDCEMGLIMYSRTASYNLNFVLILPRKCNGCEKIKIS